MRYLLKHHAAKKWRTIGNPKFLNILYVHPLPSSKLQLDKAYFHKVLLNMPCQCSAIPPVVQPKTPLYYLERHRVTLTEYVTASVRVLLHLSTNNR